MYENDLSQADSHLLKVEYILFYHIFSSPQLKLFVQSNRL